MDCRIEDLGLIDYPKAYQWQQKYVQEVIGGAPQRIVFCEHPAVITFGRLSNPENLLLPLETIESQGIKVISIDRGGDVTLHAPGQLVVYPILNLEFYGKDLHAYLNKLEQVVIDLLKDFGILANRLQDRTGVWVKDRKLASIGIGVKKWVSFHGIGININTDLSLFKIINPCGLNAKMISLSEIKGTTQDINLIKSKLVDHMSHLFKFTVLEVRDERVIA